MSKPKHTNFHEKQLCDGAVLLERGFHVCTICGWARRVIKDEKRPNLKHKAQEVNNGI